MLFNIKEYSDKYYTFIFVILSHKFLKLGLSEKT